MKAWSRAVALSVAVACSAALVPASASAKAGAKEFGPLANVTVDHETGRVTFVATDPRQSIVLPGSGSPRATALGFLADHRRAFGLRDAGRDLRVEAVNRLDDGRSSVRLQQVHRGVLVIGGELVVNLDRAGDILSASGEATPFPKLGTEPGVGAAQAARTAVGATAKETGAGAADLEASRPELSVFDSRLLGGPGLERPVLVWRTEVTSPVRPDVNQFVLVEAETGGIAVTFSQIADALERHVCDKNNARDANPATTPCTEAAAVRSEDGAASGIADVNDAYEFSGDTHEFLQSRFGRDSLDGAGLPLFSTTRYCEHESANFPPGSSPCPNYPNAFWNGSQMYYGAGVIADDVAGHELSHGLTDFTSDLLYYFQSGAINESMSDVFGEFVDLTNGTGSDSAADRWKLGEDLATDAFKDTCSAGHELRNMKDPTSCGSGDPDRITSPLYEDGNDGDGLTEDSGGVHTNSGVGNKAAYLIADGDTFNGQTIAGIGVEKAAAIYYEVQTNLLVTGSDYQDLGDSLRQACANLTGTKGITSTDCGQVNRAVLATEMDQIPPAAPNPEAPVCDGADRSQDFFVDGFDGGSSAFSGDQPPWGLIHQYVVAGDGALHTQDPPTITDAKAVSPPIPVPDSNASGGIFLHFAQAYGFEHDANFNYDGGVVEYSTDGGATWTDAGALFTHGGYNGTLASSFGNSLGGRAAFVGLSNGYISSRMDLASFAGQSIRIRFRMGADADVGYFPGWAVDSFRAYTCGVDPPPDTAISGGPANGATIDDPTPTFEFSSSESGSSFECRVDDAPAYEACISPKTLAALGDGSHVFRVRSSDAAGNTDASPAHRSFTVDTVHERKLTLRYKDARKPRKRAFKGKVRSDKRACVKRVKVKVFKKKRGRDKRIGADKTNRRGRFKVRKRRARGRYYAKVSRSEKGSFVCARAKSKKERVR